MRPPASAISAPLPPQESFSPDFLRHYHRYADEMFHCHLGQTPFADPEHLDHVVRERLQQEELHRIVGVDVVVAETRLHRAIAESFNELNPIVAHQLLQDVPRIKHVLSLALRDEAAFPLGKRVSKDDRDRVLADDRAGLGGPTAGVFAEQMNRSTGDVCGN